MRNPSLGMIGLAALVSVGLAACGGSSSSKQSNASTPSAPPATISTAQFVKHADAICAQENAQVSAFGPGLINPQIVPQARLPKAAAYLDKVVAIRTAGLSRIAALGEPSTQRAAHDALLAAQRKVLIDYRTAAAAAHRGDLTGFRAAFGRVAPHGRPTGPDAVTTATAAKAFNFKVCGKQPGI